MSTKRDEPASAARVAARLPNEAAPGDALHRAHAYQAWRAAETRCSEALHAWFDTGPTDRRCRYAAYLAVLDREEAAARHLQRVWERAQSDTPPTDAG
jgi:hypothetical protein